MAHGAEEAPELPVYSQDVSAVCHESSLEQHQRIARLDKTVADTEEGLGRGSPSSIESHSVRSRFLGTLRLQKGDNIDLEEEEARLAGTRGDVTPSNALFRIEALEANFDDMRQGILDALAVAESTETLMKTTMDHEVERLWREMQLLRTQNASELKQVEASGAKTLQRAQEVERQVQALHEEQLTRNSSLKDAYEHAMATVEKYSAEVRMQIGLTQDLHTLRESRLKFTEEEAEHVKQTQHVANTVHKLVEEIILRVDDLEQQRDKQAAEGAVVQLRLQEFECMHRQQIAGHSADHVSKSSEDLHAIQRTMRLWFQDLEQQLRAQATEVEMLQPRLQELEHAMQQQRQQQEQQQQQPADPVAKRIREEQELERVLSSLELRASSAATCVLVEQRNSSIESQEITNRLLVLEGKLLGSDGEEAAFARMSDLEKLSKSLSSTINDVATMLARKIAELSNDTPRNAVNFLGTDTTASQVTSEGSTSNQASATISQFASRLSSTESTVAVENHNVCEMLSSCVALLQAMQSDMEDLRPRVSSMEVQLTKLQVHRSPCMQQSQQQQQQQQMPIWDV